MLIKIPIININNKNSDYLLFKNDSGVLCEIYKYNIKDTLERNISWYFHDVYKNITYIYWDGLNYRLAIDKLYDKRKLKKLRNTKSFNERNFAFFDYEYVLFLLEESDCIETPTFSGIFK